MVVELTVRFYLINQEPTKLTVDVCEGLRGAVDEERLEEMVVLAVGVPFILVEALRALLSGHRISRTAGTALFDDSNHTFRFDDKNARS